MSSTLIDLTAPSITMRFIIGVTFNPTFFVLGAANSIVDLSGYKAKMQARVNLSDAEPATGFDLTTENGGLSIVTGTASTQAGTVVLNAQGVQVNVPSSVTNAVAWTRAYFGIRLIAPDLSIIPLIEGLLVPQLDAIR